MRFISFMVIVLFPLSVSPLGQPSAEAHVKHYPAGSSLMAGLFCPGM